jgi:hypothetical protein
MLIDGTIESAGYCEPHCGAFRQLVRPVDEAFALIGENDLPV